MRSFKPYHRRRQRHGSIALMLHSVLLAGSLIGDTVAVCGKSRRAVT